MPWTYLPPLKVRERLLDDTAREIECVDGQLSVIRVFEQIAEDGRVEEGERGVMRLMLTRHLVDDVASLQNNRRMLGEDFRDRSRREVTEEAEQEAARLLRGGRRATEGP